MGKTVKQLVKESQSSYNNGIILVKIDGVLQEIRDEEVAGRNVEFVTTSTAIGNETYRRSVVLLMLNAINKVAGKDCLTRWLLNIR